MNINRSPTRTGIALLLTTSAFFLFMLEGGFRLLHIEDTYRSFGYPEGLHLAHPEFGYLYTPGFVGSFPGKNFASIPIVINQQGLRDREHHYEKPKDTIRILGVGDSVTFGSGVANEDTFLAVLEHSLQKNNPSIEIVKAGINGYELDNELPFILQEGLSYDPDLVLLGVVLNDIFPVNIQQQYQTYVAAQSNNRSWTGNLGDICTSCRFFIWLTRGSIHLRQDAYLDRYTQTVLDQWNDPHARQIYFDKMDLLIQRLQQDQIPLMLVLFPYTQQLESSEEKRFDPQSFIKSFAESKKDVWIFDGSDVLDNHDELLYLGGDNVHLSVAGHVLIAQAIETFLTNHDLLP